MPERQRQKDTHMGSKTIILNPKAEAETSRGTALLGIQSDTAFNEAAKRLSGRDLCSIADLTVS
jgi:ornithine carbamoyltransferase